MVSVQTEETLVLIKPDAMERNIYPEILARYRDKGLRLVRIELIELTPEMASEFYTQHKEQDFFSHLIDGMTSGPILCCVYEGANAVNVVRKLNGLTDPMDAIPGTIRGDFGVSLDSNVVHGSDSKISASREIEVVFGNKM